MIFGFFLILVSREEKRTEFNFMVPKISVWNIAVQETISSVAPELPCLRLSVFAAYENSGTR